MSFINIKIRQSVADKIKRKKNGQELLDRLILQSEKVNNRYNRGVLHGYLLVLTIQDIISNDEAVEILDQIDKRPD